MFMSLSGRNKTHYAMFLVVLVLATRNPNGVFGVGGDEVKSLSVMEGESVTLHTDLTHIQTQVQILWMSVYLGICIAEIHKEKITIFDSNNIFGGRLKLDGQTGSLIITNITITDSGLYKLRISRHTGTCSYNKFNVTVYESQILTITEIRGSCSDLSRSLDAAALILGLVLLVML